MGNVLEIMLADSREQRPVGGRKMPLYARFQEVDYAMIDLKPMGEYGILFFQRRLLVHHGLNVITVTTDFEARYKPEGFIDVFTIGKPIAYRMGDDVEVNLSLVASILLKDVKRQLQTATASR